jgi:dihydroxyacid dehydratase/phosphogluconate dehydratase
MQELERRYDHIDPELLTGLSKKMRARAAAHSKLASAERKLAKALLAASKKDRKRRVVSVLDPHGDDLLPAHLAYGEVDSDTENEIKEIGATQREVEFCYDIDTEMKINKKK